jgi:hypothetical protein
MVGGERWHNAAITITIYKGTLPDMPQPADFGGFYYDLNWLSQHDMPMVTQTLRELPTLARFHIDGCSTVLYGL